MNLYYIFHFTTNVRAFILFIYAYIIYNLFYEYLFYDNFQKYFHLVVHLLSNKHKSYPIMIESSGSY